MAYGVRLKDESTGEIISFLRNEATAERVYTLPDRAGRVSLIDFVTPEEYGAVGDGATNDQAAIQDAIDSGVPVFFGPKNYRVNTAINLPANTKIYGCGESSIISTTSNINVFNLTGTYVTIENIKILGNSTGAAQTGVRGTGVLFTTVLYGCRIINCSFQNLGFAGIYSINNPGASNSSHEGGFWIENSRFQGCGTGIYFDDRCEYNMLNGIKVIACGTGVRFTGGNNTIVGGSITDCTTYGIQLTTGSNDGKHSIVNLLINHNGTSIISTGITNGCIFSSCSILASTTAPLNIGTSTGIHFVGCDFSGSGNTTFTNNGIVSFKSCRWVQNPAFSITGTAPLFFNNIFQTGTIPASYVNTIAGGGLTIDSDISPAELTVNTNNYAPTGGTSAYTIRISSSGAIDLTGISIGQADGRVIVLVNIGTNTITLKTNTTSTEANRFILSSDYALAPEQSVMLWYDGSSSRWRKVY